jgi:diguanylate cyclase (GGDEF)-like protein
MPVVVFDCAGAEPMQRWIDVLARHGWDVKTGTVPPPIEEVDVVVTDRLPGDEEVLQGTTGSGCRTIGEISVGIEGRGDICLPIDVAERELLTVCQLLSEITRLQRQLQHGNVANQTLRQLVATDPLTGLANRRAWDESLNALSPQDRAWCIALIDVDHFKRINQSHGFATADKVLQAVAWQIKGSARDIDLVARLGGDEFGVLLKGIDARYAAAVVERIRRSAAVNEVLAEPISASAGFSLPGEARQRPHEVFEAAAAALVLAKDAGRDRTVGD